MRYTTTGLIALSGLVLWMAGHRFYKHIQLLKEGGIKISADITRKTYEKRKNSTPCPMVYYNFRAMDGKEYDGKTSLLPGMDYNAVEISTPIDVVYLKEEPKVNSPEAMLSQRLKVANNIRIFGLVGMTIIPTIMYILIKNNLY